MVDRAALRQEDHLVEHVVEPTGWLVDGGDDGSAYPGQPLDRGQDALSRGRVEAGRGLVQQQEARVDQHLLADAHPLLLPS
uniref:Uncharacterized protein n=1 Tax=Nymphaea colorata TaxID=210225 RepID=A0A5K1CXS4_9MAGN